MADPYSWTWGSHIYAKIIAINSYGESIVSTEGNGAQIVTYPDKPVDLADMPDVTNSVQIGLQWVAGAADGGIPVLDYRIIYDQGIDAYAILASGIQVEYYKATGLTPGETYAFKIGARNAYGYSDYSDPVSILAAQEPAKPVPPTTTVSGTDVIVDWTAPNARGSMITHYTIKIR